MTLKIKTTSRNDAQMKSAIQELSRDKMEYVSVRIPLAMKIKFETKLAQLHISQTAWVKSQIRKFLESDQG